MKTLSGTVLADPTVTVRARPTCDLSVRRLSIIGSPATLVPPKGEIWVSPPQSMSSSEPPCIHGTQCRPIQTHLSRPLDGLFSNGEDVECV